MRMVFLDYDGTTLDFVLSDLRRLMHRFKEFKHAFVWESRRGTDFDCRSFGLGVVHVSSYHV
ncbi:MAG: hypothetical protein QXR87_03270, partial [Candidatus Hadarchaeales archaeon]